MARTVVLCPTRPSDTLPREASARPSTDFITDSRTETDAGTKMKNGLGRNVNAGLKPLAQYVEALRADEQVGFNRLPRTEAGF